MEISESQKRNKKNKDDFLAAYDAFAGKIYKHILFRVSNVALAQDLTSETFSRTWNFLLEGNKIDNFKSFLYRTAQNLIIDYYRKKERQNLPLEAAAGQPEQKGISFLQNINDRADFEEIIKQLNDLPENYKQILIWRFIDDLSIKEIKKISGKSLANIYVIIHRGLRFLRKKVNFHTSA